MLPIKNKFNLIVSLLIGILAFIVANIWAATLQDHAEQVLVLVASHDMAAPKILEANDVIEVGYRKEHVPKSAIKAEEKSRIIGVTLLYPVGQGQMITSSEIAGKGDAGRAGLTVPKNAKGFMLPANWLSAPFPSLSKGDTLTIAYSSQGSASPSSGVVAQGVPVVKVERGTNGQISAALLTLDEKLAVTLVQLRASNYQIATVVDGIAPESELFK